ncbi:hypothetical protein ScPMuIL_013641 [Solemya velum]
MASEENLAPEEKSADSGISMVDVLEEEKQLEDDANAVLGDSDDKNCTYPRGYLQRQALYACQTCRPQCEQPAGICLACSYECHEGHDLIELYTKRSFCCDCGNSKFPNLKCKLSPVKDAVNSKNRYNQNFHGVYCTCARPYPDPDDDVEDEMIQCVVCEDWYHGRHLGMADLPSHSNFEEMICRLCMEKHGFLWAYHVSSLGTVVSGGDESANIDVDSCHGQTSDRTNGNMQQCSNSEQALPGESPEKQKPINGSQSSCTEPSTDGSQSSLESSEICRLSELRKREINTEKSGAFWSSGWRKKLCKCGKCMTMYREEGVVFLLEEGDTVHAYEERGKARHNTESQYDQGMRALSSMDRIQQVEVIHGYVDLKSELSSYLQKFAENKKVVREEDIKEFFTEMEARKKRRLGGGIQYNCK